MNTTNVPVGQRSAFRKLRTVVFTPIVAAATVYPQRYGFRHAAHIFGALGRAWALRSIGPLPDTALYIAMTQSELRLYAKSGRSSPPFEIGRWARLTYRASVRDRGPFLKLDLELERLGRIQVSAGLRVFVRDVEPVFQLVSDGASGPVTGEPARQ